MAIRRYEKIPGTTLSRIVRDPAPSAPSAPSTGNGRGGGPAPSPPPQLSPAEQAHEIELQRKAKRTGIPAQATPSAKRFIQQQQQEQKAAAAKKAQKVQPYPMIEVIEEPAPRPTRPFRVYGVIPEGEPGIIHPIGPARVDITGEPTTPPLTMFEKAGAKMSPTISKAVSYWEMAESKARVYSRKAIPKVPTWGGFEIFGMGGLAASRIFPETQKKAMKFQTGYIAEIRQKPLKFSALVLTYFMLTPALAGVGAVGRASYFAKIPLVTKVAPYIGKAFGVGLLSSYGGVSAYRIKTSPSPYTEAGRIVGGEVTPMLVGGVAGAWAWPKAMGYLRTFGRKEIPIEKIVAPKVLTGEEKFPIAGGELTSTARARFHKQIFEKGEFIPKELEGGFPHALADPWKSLTVKEGASELPGVYVSGKGISAYFLRTGKDPYSLYGGKIFEPFGRPGVMYIQPKALEVGMARKIPGKPSKPLGWEWTKPPEKGVAVIPGMKPEVEAIIAPETQLTKLKGKFFFKFEGQRIPIDRFAVEKAGKGAGTLQELQYSYELPKSMAVTTPRSFAAGISESLRTTGVSKAYEPPSRKPPSYKPTKRPLSKPPSYKPPSRKPPSYKPTKRPPSKPSKPYKPSMPSLPSMPSRPSRPSKISKPSRISTPGTPVKPITAYFPKTKRGKKKKRRYKIKLPKALTKYKPSVLGVIRSRDPGRKKKRKKPKYLTPFGIRWPLT